MSRYQYAECIARLSEILHPSIPAPDAAIPTTAIPNTADST
jgi:hypothetical protein